MTTPIDLFSGVIVVAFVHPQQQQQQAE